MARITGFRTHDVRFPTSASAIGSDAMNPDPDYAAAYLEVRVDDGTSGHGFVFTIGRGTEVQVAAIGALEPLLAGADVDEVLGDLGGTWRRLVADSQLRWLGPEKGVMHMAVGAVTNALFDLAAKRAGLPLWRYLAALSPEELVDLVDFRYLRDALTPDEALEILERALPGRSERIAELEASGYPAYTTAPGWLGYGDERLVESCEEARKEGFGQVKLKVGARLEDDLRRCRLARETLGGGVRLAVDANQVWDVPTAISWVRSLAEFELAWVEEPTSPDDILGHAAIREGVRPVPVATGEHVANRVVFKQLLQARAIDIMQIDACRVGGVNENLANLLLAAKFDVPVCPHAGGVGLCEVVQHLAFFDYVAVSGARDGRMIEWIDHLHENFLEPASVVSGRYVAPRAPGASAELRAESIAEYTYPTGPAWAAERRPARGLRTSGTAPSGPRRPGGR
ncbi:MAG TPA: enolase C-terminal domain-like protein [Acidimicrobiales bacterium]|nr:enolase C-terminal domain-like protein [Acidimicrobiales bacterium]